MPTAWTNAEWGTLLEQIRYGNCVPFVGAGASFGVLPIGSQLCANLLERNCRTGAGACTLRDQTDLARVTQYIAVTRNDSSLPKQWICEEINAGAWPNPSFRDEPHGVLARLNAPIYITTNYDDHLRRALERQGKDVHTEVCHWNDRMRRQSASDDPGYRPDSDRPLVYHLHGRANDPESIVATEEDYLDFMVQMSRGLDERAGGIDARPMFPSVVLAALRSKSLLFVGYSLNDFNLKVVLRALGNWLGQRKVFRTTVQYDKDLVASQDYLEDYFGWALQLRVFWGTAQQFCGDLGSRI